MFNCGIDRVTTELSNQIIRQEEDTVVRVVQEAGYKVDKKQLTKALTDARAYYKDGYNDGYYDGRLDAAREMYNILIEKFNFNPEVPIDEDC